MATLRTTPPQVDPEDTELTNATNSENVLPSILRDRELHGAVWNLAWPSVAAMLLQTVNSLLDVFFVGHLPNSKSALAATGVGGQVLFLMISLAMGISVGTIALVARFIGARDSKSAEHAAGQSLSLSLILGIVVGSVFYFGRTVIVGWLLDSTANPQSASLCVQFLSAALLASVPMFLLNVLMGTFRGLGDARTPMLIQSAMVATHITCNALLIYGLLGFPHLGVRGAGTAFAISNYLGVVLYLFALVKHSPLGGALHRKHLRLRSAWATRILKIGIPAAVQAVVRTLAMMSFTSLLARTLDAEAGVAALQIGLRAEAIAFMPGFGYSVAASTLVGQSLGARKPDRAERCGWAATWQSLLVMSCMAIIFFVFASSMAAAFTHDPTVRRLGAAYLRIAAFSEPFLALGMVLTGALQGAGDTVAPTYITILTMWLLRLPLAWFLMFTMRLQTNGAWIAMATSTVVGGLMTAQLFRKGKWKRTRV